ncbi:MAG: hypothetical protein ABJL11_03990 [Parasphingorhabdus sp.]
MFFKFWEDQQQCLLPIFPCHYEGAQPAAQAPHDAAHAPQDAAQAPHDAAHAPQDAAQLVAAQADTFCALTFLALWVLVGAA